MEMTLEELATLVGGALVGDGGVRIRGVSSIAAAAADRLVFAETGAAVEAALDSPAGGVLVPEETPPASGRALIRSSSPRLAFVRAARALHPEVRPDPGVHATAVVDPTARLGEGAHVGAHAVVGAGARIGDRTVIGSGCHVGENSRIGADVRLHPRVVLYAGVTLGDRVIVHSGAVLGSDGFGYVDTPEGKEKFPQLGTLVLEDDVEIGANTTIDRGALDETRIRKGTKIDNLVQIAHNVEIGRWCAISSQSGIAGTSKIGDRAVFAGQVGIGDHVTLGEGIVLAGQAGVPTGKRLLTPGVYWGTPARPIAEARRRAAAPARIGRLVERISRLERRVAEGSGEAG